MDIVVVISVNRFLVCYVKLVEMSMRMRRTNRRRDRAAAASGWLNCSWAQKEGWIAIASTSTPPTTTTIIVNETKMGQGVVAESEYDGGSKVEFWGTTRTPCHCHFNSRSPQPLHFLRAVLYWTSVLYCFRPYICTWIDTGGLAVGRAFPSPLTFPQM